MQNQSGPRTKPAKYAAWKAPGAGFVADFGHGFSKTFPVLRLSGRGGHDGEDTKRDPSPAPENDNN